MKVILLIFLIFLIGCGSQKVATINTDKPTVLISPTALPTASPSFDSNDVTYAAMKLVSFDDGGVMPEVTNADVQKSKVLIKNLATEFDISAYQVFASASSVAAILKNTKNKEISRVKLLEGFNKLHFGLPEKNRKAAREKELQELLTLYADLMPAK